VARLVLLHGALGSGEQLTPLADALEIPARHPDLDGHGQRPAGPHDLDGFVQTATEGDGPVDLVGYSLGGYVALAAAINHPHRVRRVVTIATKLAWTPELAEKQARRLDHDRLQERNPDFLAALDGQHPGPGARAVLTHTATFLRALGSAPPLPLDRVQCPVLVVVGSDDALVTLVECEQAVAVIPDARLAVLPETPHQLERMPIAVLAGLVSTFLS
jgi:pimeloyl-ACP methyl ester carboxylesterase